MPMQQRGAKAKATPARASPNMMVPGPRSELGTPGIAAASAALDEAA
jgi:hypothetical protein